MASQIILTLNYPYQKVGVEVPLRESLYRKIKEQARKHAKAVIDEIPLLLEEGLRARLEE